MKSPRFLSFIIVGLLAACLGAAPIDGKWKLEPVAAKGKAKGAKKVKTLALDLQSTSDKLTGRVIASTGRRERAFEIADGKIEGNKFSFTTLQKGKKGERKVLWEGTLEGDTLKGIQAKNGKRKRALEFTAKREL